MAYYLTLKEKKLWVPLVNCKKDELKLKPEIWEHVIVKCKIPIEDLIFTDELLSYGKEHAEYALIDHNKLDGKQAENFGGNAHLFDLELFNKGNDPNFAFFLAAAISLDTHNFDESYKNKKWSLEDIEQVQWLRKFATIDDAYFNLY